jgi:hypothetical protein
VRFVYLYIAVLSACQGGSSKQAEDRPPQELSREIVKDKRPAGPASMVATKTDGNTKIADVLSGRPCRAQIEGTDFIVGIEPFVMMVGETRYEGQATSGSLVLTKNGAAIARYMETGEELSVFGTDGAALFRVTASEGVVRNSAGSPVREVRREGEAFVVSSSAGDIYVTGPADVLLAAVVTATEASPEVRALAACHRMQKVAP